MLKVKTKVRTLSRCLSSCKTNLPTSMSAFDELALLPSSAWRDRPEYLSRWSSVLSVVGFESPAMNGRENLVDSAAFGVVLPREMLFWLSASNIRSRMKGINLDPMTRRESPEDRGSSPGCISESVNFEIF